MTEVHAEIDRNRGPRGAAIQPELATAGEHPVIRLPFNVLINGRSYIGNRLSVVGAEATGLIDPQLNGRVQVATLVFNFPGYALSLPVDAAIAASDTQTGMLNLRFLEPTGPHLPQLRYILNAYVGGELVGVDGLIRASDKIPGPARAEHVAGNAVARGIGNGIRWGLFAGLGLLLVGFVGAKLYERLFVLPVTGLSTVSLDGTGLRAISPGQLDFVNPAAVMGDVAFAIRTTSGEVLAVSMPCDCVVAPGSAETGATVLAGDVVMTIAPKDAQVVIASHVDANGLRVLSSGALAEVHLPDGRVTSAALDRADMPAIMRSIADEEFIAVNLVPAAPIPLSEVGSPVEMVIKSDPIAAIARFFAVRSLGQEAAK